MKKVKKILKAYWELMLSGYKPTKI